MNKLLFFTFLLSFMFSCTNDDWKDEFADMQTELDAIKEEVANQKKLIEALQKNTTISGIEQEKDGCTIQFSDGQSIIFTNRKPSFMEIGEHGHWLIDGKDTQISSKEGGDRFNGTAPKVSVGNNGHWLINGKDTQISAKEKNGQNEVSSPCIDLIIDHVTEFIFHFTDGLQIAVAKTVSYQGVKLNITIPDTIYAVVDTELRLWNDAVSLSVDKGLSSPVNYQVLWKCSKGFITDRGYRFLPTADDLGNHTCVCELYDLSYRLIASKEFVIQVLSKDALKEAKNIVYFGDSLGAGIASNLYRAFQDGAKFTGVIPRMLGTRSTNPGCCFEAVGGYRWEDYATKGRCAYRIDVKGFGAINLGAHYKLDGYDTPFEIREVNLTNGVGNLLIELQYGAEAKDFPASGTLIRVGGGRPKGIRFENGRQEPNNPLWNQATNRLDVALYKQRIGLRPEEKIDAVSFQFGINDNGLANHTSQLITYIQDLYDVFMADNPRCKFLLGLTTTSGNDVNGAGMNYGASYDWINYTKNVYKLRQFYLTLQDSPEFPNLIIAPVSLGIDRYYGYDLSKSPIPDDLSDAQNYHTNYVHPCTRGYQQLADMYFATFVYALTR